MFKFIEEKHNPYDNNDNLGEHVYKHDSASTLENNDTRKKMSKLYDKIDNLFI